MALKCVFSSSQLANLILKFSYYIFFRFTYKSPENQHIIDKVRGLNPNFLTRHVRGTTIIVDTVCIASYIE